MRSSTSGLANHLQQRLPIVPATRLVPYRRSGGTRLKLHEPERAPATFFVLIGSTGTDTVSDSDDSRRCTGPPSRESGAIYALAQSPPPLPPAGHSIARPVPQAASASYRSPIATPTKRRSSLDTNIPLIVRPGQDRTPPEIRYLGIHKPSHLHICSDLWAQFRKLP
jgi:hypothetical protein